MDETALRAGAVGLLLASILWGCSSTPLHRDETGSSGAGGAGPESNGGAAGQVTSTGGVPGISGSGGFIEEPTSYPGSCVLNQPNPDFANGGNCPTIPPAVPSLCTRDCCTYCGIDTAGSAMCVCDRATGTYSSCTCTPPAAFPVGLSGGTCSPQGYAATVPPASAPPGSISLQSIPCRKTNAVCFTADSAPASQRGCICFSDGIMHCGFVHGWFTQVDGETTYN